MGCRPRTCYGIYEYDAAAGYAKRTRQLGTYNLETGVKTGTTGTVRRDTNPLFYGDIMGDWCEEVVYQTFDSNELVVFTTDTPTTERIHTLAHNPAYRNDVTRKGYMQDHEVDYYLEFGSQRTTTGQPIIPQPNVQLIE